MNTLKWLDKSLAKLEGLLVVLFLWTMVLLTFVQVCLRAFYTYGDFQWANTLIGYLYWSDPLVRLLVLWLTFLGASLITGENKHIRIDLLSTLLPSRLVPHREFLISLACVLISAIMLKVSLDYLKLEMEFGATMFLNLPNWIGQLILPFGFALILFRFLIRAIDKGQEIVKGVST